MLRQVIGLDLQAPHCRPVGRLDGDGLLTSAWEVVRAQSVILLRSSWCSNDAFC